MPLCLNQITRKSSSLWEEKGREGGREEGFIESLVSWNSVCLENHNKWILLKNEWMSECLKLACSKLGVCRNIFSFHSSQPSGEWLASFYKRAKWLAQGHVEMNGGLWNWIWVFWFQVQCPFSTVLFLASVFGGFCLWARAAWARSAPSLQALT